MSTPIGKLTYSTALERAAMAQARRLVRAIQQSGPTLDPREIRLILQSDAVLGSVLSNARREPLTPIPDSEE